MSSASELGLASRNEARKAGLRYSSDDRPGISRKRAGSGFGYADGEGFPVRDRFVVQRLKNLAIPPAWTSVWISSDPLGHLQATGRDTRGRKQYRYHERWREVRDENKYGRMIDFSKALPRIRTRANADLRLPGLPRKKLLAAVVLLLERTLIRVGNEEYARENRSFGLTTLRNRHVNVRGSRLIFRFRGKSGISHEVRLIDRRLAHVVGLCQELSGQDLFQYVDDTNASHSIDSDDVNAYLREAAEGEFTAKDFRTWAGTVLAMRSLVQFEVPSNSAEAKGNILRAIDGVAKRLGNTRAICRKCYVHPAVLDAYLDGELRSCVPPARASTSSAGVRLSAEEKAVVAVLKRRSPRERAVSPAAA